MGRMPEGEWEGTVVGPDEDGSHFVARVAMTPERSEDGMPIGFLAMSSDIVEDVRLHVDLHRTPAYAHSAIEFVPDAMVIVSAWDEAEFANTEDAILLGDSHERADRPAVEVLIADRYLDRHPGLRMGFFSDSRAHLRPARLEGSVRTQTRAANCYVHNSALLGLTRCGGRG
jgi:hypothetical protein